MPDPPRIAGDTVFIVGTAAIAYFMLGLWTGWRYQREPAAVREGATGAISDALRP